MATDAAPDDASIKIVPYDGSWPARFAAEQRLLEQAVGAWATGGIHHVGSTAVPGLAAKPIIDILVGVEDLEAARACFDRLMKLGYKYAPYRAQEMHWFCKPDPRHRTHHLHLVPSNSGRYAAELAFRDALCRRSDLAERYAMLKLALARAYGLDRDGYSEAKSAFIADVLREVPMMGASPRVPSTSVEIRAVRPGSSGHRPCSAVNPAGCRGFEHADDGTGA